MPTVQQASTKSSYKEKSFSSNERGGCRLIGRDVRTLILNERWCLFMIL